MSFDRTKIKSLRKEINSALEVVGQKHGLVFNLGSITFGQNSFGCRLEVASSENGESVYAVAFKEKCAKYGLLPSELGKEFWSNGNRFKITGLKTRNRKYPILADRTGDGKGYKFSATQVIIALGR